MRIYERGWDRYGYTFAVEHNGRHHGILFRAEACMLFRLRVWKGETFVHFDIGPFTFLYGHSKRDDYAAF